MQEDKAFAMSKRRRYGRWGQGNVWDRYGGFSSAASKSRKEVGWKEWAPWPTSAVAGSLRNLPPHTQRSLLIQGKALGQVGQGSQKQADQHKLAALMPGDKDGAHLPLVEQTGFMVVPDELKLGSARPRH